MKKTRLFVSLLAAGLLSIAPAAAQTQVVKLTTAKAVGATMTLKVNQLINGVTVDWGDGNVVAYPRTAGQMCEITGEVKGNVVTLTGGKRLHTLVCEGNELTAVDATGATFLRSLYCQDNQIEKLDIAGCRDLTDLNVANNKLATLVVTEKNFPALENVNLANNSLENNSGSGTTFVLRNKCLQHLNVSGNKFTIAYFTANPDLDVLKCSDNEIGKKLNLSLNKNLSVLVANNNLLTGITTPKDGLVDMKAIVVDNNSISGAVNLSASENLSIISCANNEIDEIGLPKYKLSWIDCTNNCLGFNSLPGASTRPEQMRYAPQKNIDISDVVKKTADGGWYVDICPSYDDRMSSEYLVDFTDWAKDGDGGNVTFKFYKKAADGTEEEMTRVSAGSQGNDYFANLRTRGQFSFMTPQSHVYLKMTSKTYPDLELQTGYFAVGAENVTVGIGNIVAGSKELSIRNGRGQLFLSSAAMQFVRIYSLSGKLVWSGNVGQSEVAITLPQGVYVVNGKKVVL